MGKVKIDLILLIICMLFTMSMVATNEVKEAFRFDMFVDVEKDSTFLATKRDNANYAGIEFWELRDGTNKSLYYHLRDYQLDKLASNVYMVNTVMV